jgi:hypothetical protein
MYRAESSLYLIHFITKVVDSFVALPDLLRARVEHAICSQLPLRRQHFERHHSWPTELLASDSGMMGPQNCYVYRCALKRSIDTASSKFKV